MAPLRSSVLSLLVGTLRVVVAWPARKVTVPGVVPEM